MIELPIALVGGRVASGALWSLASLPQPCRAGLCLVGGPPGRLDLACRDVNRHRRLESGLS